MTDLLIVLGCLIAATWLVLVFGRKYLENQRPDAYEQWCREMRAKDPSFVEPYVWVERNGKQTQVHRSEVDPVYRAEYEARVAKWRAEATIDPKTL